jgi:hypothetical protein
MSTRRQSVRSFDHTRVAALPEYAAASEALDALAAAIDREGDDPLACRKGDRERGGSSRISQAGRRYPNKWQSSWPGALLGYQLQVRCGRLPCRWQAVDATCSGFVPIAAGRPGREVEGAYRRRVVDLFRVKERQGSLCLALRR